MTCDEIWSLMELPPEAATGSLVLAFEKHLLSCRACMRRAQQTWDSWTPEEEAILASHPVTIDLKRQLDNARYDSEAQ